MKPSHKRAIRRDRRKAKASGWRRQGKTKMGIVGHGPNGGSLHQIMTLACGVATPARHTSSAKTLLHRPFADALSAPLYAE